GPPLALGLGLPGHGALHALGQVHVLDLHPLDANAPRPLGRLVDDPPQFTVDGLALGEQLVHLRLADDRPQRGLRLLGYGEHVVLHVDDGLDRVHHAEVHHGAHPDADVVPGDALRGGNRNGDDLHVALLQLVADGPDDGQPRPFGLWQDLPEPENQPALALLHDPPGTANDGQAADNEDDENYKERC